MSEEHFLKLKEKAAWVKQFPIEAAELILQQQKDIEFYQHALNMRETQLNKLLGGNK